MSGDETNSCEMFPKFQNVMEFCQNFTLCGALGSLNSAMFTEHSVLSLIANSGGLKIL